MGHLLFRGLSKCPFFRFSYQVAVVGFEAPPSDYQADVLPPDHPAPYFWIHYYLINVDTVRKCPYSRVQLINSIQALWTSTIELITLGLMEFRFCKKKNIMKSYLLRSKTQTLLYDNNLTYIQSIPTSSDHVCCAFIYLCHLLM